MHKIFKYILKSLRKVHEKLWNKTPQLKISEQNPNTASQLIFDTLISNEPCMIARFGAFELNTVVNYLGVKSDKKNALNYIRGNEPDWWWTQSLIQYMHTNAGFFPPTVDKIEEFCKLMINDIPEVDILGSWLSNEKFVKTILQSEEVHIRLLEPFWAKTPWTKALAGKKVLVVHPFNKTIEEQYKKRKVLFKNEILPEFELITIPAVQSIGNNNDFTDWFEALDYMKNKIDKVDYDICLIGAGAYGFPLAAHVKRSGKKAVHLGGSLQLLFGIRGKRWEDPNYGVKKWDIPTGSYSSLINENWVRPGENEKPKNANAVEGACYW
ncbi:hypothetical protein I2486_05570 [Cellulophaga sp. E16_2]|uniref:hypothetical protein n=1 Tax=Cellulophaga sp. E16_2 TaxID=2789297 RepID=UPI001A91EC97|nr:hypothetical protein [Cellulophaga sp. E16_2]MBO0590872.1 hypothetical protein [Cellulophaga sp. E16_2]